MPLVITTPFFESPEQRIVVTGDSPLQPPQYSDGKDAASWLSSWQTATGVANTGTSSGLMWGANGRGFVSSNNDIYYTLDSGSTWAIDLDSVTGFTSGPRGFWLSNQFYLAGPTSGNDLTILNTTNFGGSYSTFTNQNFGTTNTFDWLAYNTNNSQYWGAVGGDGSNNARVAFSDNGGSSWAEDPTFLGGNDFRLWFGYLNDAWFLGANGRGIWRCSTDSAGGAYSNVFPGFDIASMAYGNGVYVAYRNAVPAIATSSDGISWATPAQTNGPSQSQGDSLSFSEKLGLFVVGAGVSGLVKVSADAVTWTTVSPNLSTRFRACSFVPNF